MSILAYTKNALGKISMQNQLSVITNVPRNSIIKGSLGFQNFELNPCSWNWTKGTTAKTDQEMRLTAPMDGFVWSPGVGCVTPAPRNITGSWNILGGLNKNCMDDI